jgi:Kef-type K+ transport system membrane component KefB
MSEGGSAAGIVLVVLGTLTVLAILLRLGLRRLGVPAVAGFMALGLVVRILEEQTGFLADPGATVIEFLGTLGIVALLFVIGLEADLGGLLRQLRSASFIWLVNVVVSAAAGYATARWLLGFGATPSVVVAVAFSATSVGISSRVWKDAGRLDSDAGEGFLDVAELDDISAVALMGMLFAVLPRLEGSGLPLDVVAGTVGWFLVKALVLAAACAGFSLFAEERITGWLERTGIETARMLGVFGIGLAIAGAAALVGMSPAIGAFFAGLAFSRDPERVRIDASIGPVAALLSPFFFIAVGFSVPPASLTGAVVPGLALTAAAILAKLVGAGLPALPSFGRAGAVLIGVSMVPRAEITLVVMEQARRAGAVPSDLYSGMVLVAVVTSIAGPVMLAGALRRLPAAPEGPTQRSSRE